jgi:hypothetical protein
MGDTVKHTNLRSRREQLNSTWTILLILSGSIVCYLNEDAPVIVPARPYAYQAIPLSTCATIGDVHRGDRC